MVELPDDPVDEWGLERVKRKFVNEYEAWDAGRTGGVFRLTYLNRLHTRLREENVDVDALIEKRLSRN